MVGSWKTAVLRSEGPRAGVCSWRGGSYAPTQPGRGGFSQWDLGLSPSRNWIWCIL